MPQRVVAAIQKRIKRSSRGVKGPLKWIGITMKRAGPFDQLALANQYLKSGKVLTHQGIHPHEEVIDSDNSLPKDGPDNSLPKDGPWFWLNWVHLILWRHSDNDS